MTVQALEPPAVSESCARLLHRARGRTRRQTTLGAFLRMSAATGAALASELLLDYYLDIPPAVRAVVLAAIAFLLVRWSLRFVVRPLAAPQGDDELARIVERAHPEIGGHLVTAVQLARPGNPAARDVSAALIRAVTAEAGRHAGRIDVAELLPARLLAAPAAAFLGMCGLAIAALAATGGPLSVWANRLALGSMAWPRDVELVFSQPAGDEVLVASGDDLLVEVGVVRGRARHVELVCDWGRDGGGEKIEPMTAWGDRIFRHTLPNITRAFTLSARGGDGRTGRVEVRIVARPRIERIVAQIAYPAYAGVPPQVSEDGTVKALMGSQVTFAAVAVPRIANAEFQLFPSGAKEASERRAVEVAPREGGGSLVQGSFAVNASGYYTFKLTSEEGFESDAPSRYRIRAIADAIPRLTIVRPAPTEESTREAEVAIEGKAVDDWGIASARFVFRLRKPEEKEPGAEEDRPLAVEAGAKEAAIRLGLSLAPLALQEGATVLYRLEATDVAGGVGRSAEQAIIIVGAEDLRDILFDRLNALKEEMRSLAEVQERARLRLEDLAQKSAQTSTLGNEAASPLAQARADEMGLARRLEAAAGEFARLRERMVRNAVGDLKEQKWVGSLGEEVGDLARERARPLGEEIAALAEKVATGSASPAKIEPLIAQGRDLERALRDLVDRMTQFGDINQLLRELEDILSVEQKIRDDTRRLLPK